VNEARNNGHPDLRKNIAPRKRGPDPHSCAVQHHGVTVAPSSTSEVFLMTNSSRLAAALGASLLLFATPVFAQSTAAPAAKSDTAAPAPMAKTSKPRSAESLECSKEADAKGLHGKERKKFRSECKKAAMDKKQ
jgi:psiF repeat